MFKIIIVFSSLLIAIVSCQTLTKFNWSTCPGVTSVINVLNMDVTPMVFILFSKKLVKTSIQAVENFKRTVSITVNLP